MVSDTYKLKLLQSKHDELLAAFEDVHQRLTALEAENEILQRKLHDAIVKYQRLLMQYEPEKAAGLADATFRETGDGN